MNAITLTQHEIQQLEKGDNQLWVAYIKLKQMMSTAKIVTLNEGYPIHYNQLARQLRYKNQQGKKHSTPVCKERARYLIQKMQELGLVKRADGNGNPIRLKLLLDDASALTNTKNFTGSPPSKPHPLENTNRIGVTGSEMEETVKSLFSYWQTVHEHPDTQLTPAFRKALRYALHEGYTVEQCRQAIQGCRRSDFHRGNNPQGVRYDSLTLIFRDRTRIEQFIQLNQSRPLQAQTTAARKSPRSGLDVLIEAFDANYGEQLGCRNPFMPNEKNLIDSTGE